MGLRPTVRGDTSAGRGQDFPLPPTWACPVRSAYPVAGPDRTESGVTGAIALPLDPADSRPSAGKAQEEELLIERCLQGDSEGARPRGHGSPRAVSPRAP